MQTMKAVSLISEFSADEFTRKMGEQMDILGSDPNVTPSFDYRTDVIGNKVHHSALVSWWEWQDVPIPPFGPVYRPEVQVTRDDQTADWVVRVDGITRFRLYSDGSGFEEV